jgi:hypothetical protein
MRNVLRWMMILMLGVGASFACSAASAGELDGRWPCGRWTDDNTGHEGPLRGRFRQIDDCHYRVVFTGKFAKVVPFLFVTKMNIVGREGDKVFLAGESRLPGMGKFTYNAVADEHNFNSQYSSRRWSGEFTLSR